MPETFYPDAAMREQRRRADEYRRRVRVLEAAITTCCAECRAKILLAQAEPKANGPSS